MIFVGRIWSPGRSLETLALIKQQGKLVRLATESINYKVTTS